MRKYALIGLLLAIPFFFAVRLPADFFILAAAGYQVVRVLASLTTIIFMTIFLSVVTGKIQREHGLKRLRFYTLAGVALWFVIGFVYFTFLPPIYFSILEDWQRGILRVLVHPLLFEIAATAARNVARLQSNLPSSALFVWPGMVLVLGRYSVGPKVHASKNPLTRARIVHSPFALSQPACTGDF
jgi:hypothetical protein